jgi:hypothetical protein
MEPIVSFLTWLKEAISRPTGVFIAVALASVFLLFMGDPTAEFLGLTDLRRQYKGWIAGALVVSVAAFISIMLLAMADAIKPHVKARRERRKFEKSLTTLSPAEKAYLVFHFLQPNKKVRELPNTDSIATALARREILQCPTYISRDDLLTYVVSDWAWEYFSHHAAMSHL